MVLGMPWIRKNNPVFDWNNLSVSLNPIIDESQKLFRQTVECDYFYDPSNVTKFPALYNMIVADSDVDETKILPRTYQEFQDVFSEDQAEILPQHRKYDCPIDLVPDAKQPFKGIYQLSPLETKALKDYIDENLKKGFIRPSKSAFGSPIFFVPKKNKELRPCVDYRSVNKITIKNRHPLPLITEMLDRVGKARIFSKIDLKGAYNLVRMRFSDEHKTAFRCQFGHFKYTVMPFGLTNAPAVFQAMMLDIFRDIIDIYVIVYLDDILIFSENEKIHEIHVKEVLRRLSSNKLYAKLSKCLFHVKKVEFLGFVLSSDGISMAPNKVKAVQEWLPPKNQKELMSFLGFTNFYRKFIPNYSAIATSLTSLLKKDVPFVWTKSCQDSFEKLKTLITTDVLLHHVDQELPYLLETDASDYALGAVLSQFPTKDTHDISQVRPIAFYSRKFLPAECNYTVHDKELLAIVDSFKHWRHYLLGVSTSVQVLSDHRNLEYFRKKPILRPRHARWSTTLADYDFRLVYRAGIYNVVADALSRANPPLSGEENSESSPSPLTHTNRSLIAAISTEPLSKEDILHILETRHDSVVAGHPGVHKTYKSIAKDFYWPNMLQDIKDYVNSCIVCQKMKNSRTSRRFPIIPIEAPKRPWSMVSVDFIVKLPVSQGFDSIFVVIDHFTKMAHFLPCKESITAKETAIMFLKNIFKLHGFPEKIISDRGPQFVSKFWSTVFESAGSKVKETSAFHPQSNGLTERTNQSLEQYLRCFINHEQNNWVDLLSYAEFAFKNVE